MTVVGVISKNSADFVREVFTHVRAGSTVVPLRSREDRERIQAAFVQQITEPADGGGWLEEKALPFAGRSDALVLFTSGTEGEPKGIFLTQEALGDVVLRLNNVMKPDASIREYVGVPVYHSFGLGRCRAVAAAGGKIFIPENGFNPAELARMLQDGSVNAFSAVPTLLRILLDSGSVSPELASRVKWIEIGSQYMSAHEKLRLRTLFCEAKIVQHYGLTEASRTTLLEIDEVEPHLLDSVGKVQGEVCIRVNDDGKISIKGPHVSERILSAGLTIDSRDPEGWYETNDWGELREGYLFFKGRADDVINCGGLKIAPEALESKVCDRLKAGPSLAIFRTNDPLRGDGIGVALTPEFRASEAQALEATADALKELGLEARSAVRVVRVSKIPRTASGKVRRRELTQVAPVTAAEAGESGPLRDIRTIFSKALGVPEVRSEDTFVDLGGDSLAFVQASVALENVLGRLPPGWERMRVSALLALSPTREKLAQLDPTIVLRAVAIMTIVSNHAGLFGPVGLPGGAFLLLVLSGASFARFQLQRVVSTARPIFVLSTVPRLLLPVLGLLVAEQLRHAEFKWSQLLLVSNLISPEAGGYWFVNVWVQTYVFVFLLFSVPPFLRFARSRPFTAALSVLGLATCMQTLVPLFWSTDHLYNRVPHMWFWAFSLGWCLVLGSARHRVALTPLVLVLPVVLDGLSGPSLWILVGSLALLWLPPVPAPRLMARALGGVAAASLYIYVTHFYFISAAQKLVPQFGSIVGWVSAILGGIALQIATDQVWSIAGRRMRRADPAGHSPA